MKVTTNLIFKIAISLLLDGSNVNILTTNVEAAVPFTFSTRPGTNVQPFPIPPSTQPVATNLPAPFAVWTWQSNSLQDVVNDNDLTAHGSTTFRYGNTNGGYYTNTLYCDGTEANYWTLPSFSLAADESFTLIAHAKFASTNGFFGIVDGRSVASGNDERMQLAYWNLDNNMFAGIGSTSAGTFTDVFMPTNAVNLLSNWHAYIMINDRVRGELIGSIDGAHWWTNAWPYPNNTAAGPLYIGRGLPPSPVFGFGAMNGDLGQIQLWKSNLTVVQVAYVVNTNDLGVPLGIAWPAPTNSVEPPPPPPTNVFYIGPNGGSTPAFNGSSNAPWSMEYAFGGAGGRVVPGVTNYILGGTYSGPQSVTIGGNASTSVVFSVFPGHRARLRNAASGSDNFASITLKLYAANVIVEGLEIDQIGSTFSGYPGPGGAGAGAAASNIKLINCWIHDTGEGFVNFYNCPGITVDECIFQYIGDKDSGSLDHAIYSHNTTHTTNFYNDTTALGVSAQTVHFIISSGPGVWDFQCSNMVCFASVGPHVLTRSGSLQFTNIAFENGIFHHPRTSSAQNIYFDDGNHGSFSHNGIRFAGNIFSGGSGLSFSWRRVVNSQCVSNIFVNVSGQLFDWQQGSSKSGVTVDYNDYFYPTPGAAAWYFGASSTSAKTFAQWQADGSDVHGQYIITGFPTNIIRVYPSKYRQGRGRVAVCNWRTNNFVNVDLSPILRSGDTYRIAPVFNLTNYCVTGTFNGAAVSIPMTNMVHMAPGKQLSSEATNFYQMGGIFTPTNKLEFMTFKVEKTN